MIDHIYLALSSIHRFVSDYCRAFGYCKLLCSVLTIKHISEYFSLWSSWYSGWTILDFYFTCTVCMLYILYLFCIGEYTGLLVNRICVLDMQYRMCNKDCILMNTKYILDMNWTNSICGVCVVHTFFSVLTCLYCRRWPYRRTFFTCTVYPLL